MTLSQKWREITSVEDVFVAFPDTMEKMLGEFNLESPGLEKVKTAQDAGLPVEACSQLLHYYKRSDNALHLRKTGPARSDRTEAKADTVIENVFIIQNVRGRVPRGDDGHLDWHYKGPNHDSEWAWLSNRHNQLLHVFNVYMETGNPKYATYIDEFLRDFIIKSMPYPAEKSGDSIWRGLEVAGRAKNWSRIFYGMMNSEHLSPATRLLLLSSLPDHAHYSRNFHNNSNWLTMEMTALATIATNFPEYKNSGKWLDYSIDAMVKSMKEQVYPDGVQTELTSHYHNVSLSNFELLQEICDRAGKQLPDFFIRTIVDMYFYIAHAVRPNGYRILNNDGDLASDRERILSGARKFNKPDWEYIVTNGHSGTKPVEGPSSFFPWAGHLISRSGFGADAHWSFFDIGPWGSGHQHNDKLHISIAAFGRDLLVDAGRFAYKGDVADRFRPYACGSQGHNVLLIDGKGQEPGPRLAEKPVAETHWRITDEYDYARSSFDRFIDVEGQCEHTRSLYYARGDLWVVVDQVKTDRTRKIDTLWHWHPECEVGVEGNRTFTQNEKGNLQLIPVGNQDWELTCVKGQEKPEIQGWYSETYNKYEPNNTSIYSTRIESDHKFVWVLFPSEKMEKGVQVRVLSETRNEMTIKVVSQEMDERIFKVPLSKR
jgi:hypothetical protein